MQSHAHEANVITYYASISGRPKAAQWPLAVGSVEEMKSDGTQADVMTYNSTNSACSRGRQRQRAIGLTEKRQSHVLEANVITDHATISACSRGRQWLRAVCISTAPRALGWSAHPWSLRALRAFVRPRARRAPVRSAR